MHEGSGQLADDAQHGQGQHLGIAVGDPALDDGVLQMTNGVGHGDLLAAPEGLGEARLGLGELHQRDEVAVPGRPGQGRPDAELDAEEGIDLVADGGLLAPP